MPVPSFLFLDCPVCGEETKHRVLSGKESRRRLLGVGKCTACDDTHKFELEIVAEIEVPAILSQGNVSTKSSIMVPEGIVIEVGDEIMLDKAMVVSAIDIKDARVQKAPAADILTIWLSEVKPFVLDVSVSYGEKNVSKKIEPAIDEEFSVGDVMDIDGEEVRISRMLTRWGPKSAGTYKAGDIKRVYTRPTRQKRRRYQGHRPDKKKTSAVPPKKPYKKQKK